MSTGQDFDVKERVKDANNIVDVIGADFQLRRQGSIYVCLCPWHQDTRPSLQVNPARQSFACYVCDIRGDVFDYVMRRDHVEFRDALEFLAERVGIPLRKFQARVKPGSPQDKKSLFKACAWAKQEFHRLLLDSDAAEIVRNYLASRGITDESIEEFEVGFSPASFNWLSDRARNTEFSPEVLEACGLIKPNQYGWTDRFRGRVIFPIHDVSQRTIAFGGRVVPGLFPDGQEPPGKYINSPETRLFSKSETLYALNMVRDNVAKSREITVVEGYTDVIAAWQVGLRDVVACLGVALNDRHLGIIRRFADRITLVLDGDAAGQKRANEILDLFVAEDVDLRIMTLPDNADPFDFVMKNGMDQFQAMVAGAPDAISHKINTETRGIDLVNDSHQANRALERILETLSRTPVSLVNSAGKLLRQDQILARLARQFQLDLPQIRTRLFEIRDAQQRRRSPVRQSPETTPVAAFDPAKFDRKEMELLELVIDDGDLIDLAIENVSPGQFVEGPLKVIYEQIIELFHHGEEISFRRLMLEFEDGQIKNTLVFLSEEAEEKRNLMEQGGAERMGADVQLNSVIQAFQNLLADSERRATINKLQQKQFDQQEEADELQQLLQQVKQRQGL